VKSRAKTNSARRKPIQEQAQVTVEAMLDAAVKLLKRSGAASLTTNRIAETAGVSIGCVYQYFPNERAIFIAPHEMHIRQVDRVMQRRTAASAEATLEDLISSMVDGTIEAHTALNYQICFTSKCHIELMARESSRFIFRGVSDGACSTCKKSWVEELIWRCEPFLWETCRMRSATRSWYELIRAILSYLQQ
jgi:AcrR family transcriptional regulator